MLLDKENLHRLIDTLPDDATYDDVQHCLYVRQRIDRSTAEIERGETIPHEEMLELFDKWLEEDE